MDQKYTVEIPCAINCRDDHWELPDQIATGVDL